MEVIAVMFSWFGREERCEVSKKLSENEMR